MMFKKAKNFRHFEKRRENMLDRTLFYTALFSAIIMLISLKFFELFSFINWSPIGWGGDTSLLPTMHFTVKWGLLFIALFLVFILLYMIMYYLVAIPPSMSAIFFTVVLVFLVEWFISDTKTPWETIQSVSVPLLSVTAILLRFISGTAVFYHELSKKE